MMTHRSILAVVAVLLLLSMGAVFISLTSPMHHEMGCPFMPGHEVACVGPLEHVSHWQSSFLAVVAEILIFFTLLVLAFKSRFFSELDIGPPQRIFSQTLHPYRPTLLQELFSKGILNRKEPYLTALDFLHV